MPPMTSSPTALKNAFPTHQMWILQFFDNLNIVKLDVEVLIDASQIATDLDIILELHRDWRVDERFEEAEYVSWG